MDNQEEIIKEKKKLLVEIYKNYKRNYIKLLKNEEHKVCPATGEIELKDYCMSFCHGKGCRQKSQCW